MMQIYNLPNQEKEARDYIEQLIGKSKKKPIKIEVGLAKKDKSPQLHRYYFGVIVGGLSNRCGLSRDQVHNILKSNFLPDSEDSIMRVKMGSLSYIEKQEKTIVGLDNKTFIQYIKDIQEWAFDSLSWVIPQPNEDQISELTQQELSFWGY